MIQIWSTLVYILVHIYIQTVAFNDYVNISDNIHTNMVHPNKYTFTYIHTNSSIQWLCKNIRLCWYKNWSTLEHILVHTYIHTVVYNDYVNTSDNIHTNCLAINRPPDSNTNKNNTLSQSIIRIIKPKKKEKIMEIPSSNSYCMFKK